METGWRWPSENVFVHVRIADGLARRPTPDLARRQKLTAELGGTYTKISAHGVVQGLADAARSQGAAVIVVGRHRSRLAELAPRFGGRPAAQAAARGGDRGGR